MVFLTKHEHSFNDYLTNRQQRVKVNGSFSYWKDLTRGVPRGSVLGPLLFNMYINDVLLFIKNSYICNYADDTTIYSCDRSLDNIRISLKMTVKANQWNFLSGRNFYCL